MHSPEVTIDPSDTTPTGIFGAWGRAEQVRGELNAESVAKYRLLWMAWLNWCASESTPWDQVTPADIVRFLNGPPPGNKAGSRPAMNSSSMTRFTKNRYWRVLRGVYTHASKIGHTQSNLALNVDEKDRPSVAAPDKLAQVLEPSVFAALRELRTIEKILPDKSEANWWFSRDRAMLCVVLECGVTTAELIALRGMDLREASNGQIASSIQQADMLDSISIDLLLDVMDTENHVGRTLRIQGDRAMLVRQWVAWRNRLLIERAAKAVPLARREAFMALHATQGPLFFARRARESTDVFPKLDTTSVYYLFSECMKRLRKVADLPPQTHIAKGPSIIRNTVIKNWIALLGPEAAASMAGLKDIHSLRVS